MKKAYSIFAAMVISAALCGCSASSVSSPSSYSSSESSATPFDDPVSVPLPDDPFITYLGNEAFEGTRTLELYQNSFSTPVNAPINYIRVGENELEDALSVMLASDNSPDLCVKTENAIPYLASKNLFEDLTDYMDVSAPQWSGCADIIEAFRFNGARYFYPTEIVYSPQFLIYDENRLRETDAPDPSVLMKHGEWKVSSLGAFVNATALITGESAAENLFAAYGKTPVYKNDQGSYVFSDDENTKKAYEFIKENVTSDALGGISRFVSGDAVFLSGGEQTLSVLRAAYPESEFGIAPYPQGEGGTNYCRVDTSGYLVPEGAKNIKGAASFINCSRIAAEESGYSARGRLTEADMKALELIRSPLGKEPVIADVLRFDSDTNGALEGFYADIGGSSDWDELAVKYKPVIERGLEKINSLNKLG